VKIVWWLGQVRHSVPVIAELLTYGSASLKMRFLQLGNHPSQQHLEWRVALLDAAGRIRQRIDIVCMHDRR
jgi:hypothetical protein